ncbi:MAG TPA: hypothetical protein PKG69_04710 [Methanoregulaceae archaeon]|nr:hypothetical protein [Methanoregulaceae archaeon]
MIEIEESLKLIERYRRTLETVQSEDFQKVLKKHHMGNIPQRCTSSIYTKLLHLENEMSYLDSIVEGAKNLIK